MKRMHSMILLVGVGLLVAGPAACVLADPIVSGDLSFTQIAVPSVSGSGVLDIILFTGNAVANPTGIPNPNGGMPGNGKTFEGGWATPGDTETMTVQELLDFLHATRGADANLLEVAIDVNEPGAGKKHALTIDQFDIRIGTTTYSTASPVELNGPDSGSGYSDFVIRGVNGIDLTGFNPTDTVSFYLKASDLDGGFEEFFISGYSGGGGVIPEPATMGLLGIGLVFTVATRRKKLGA